ncbi:SNF2 domain-containing protein CLASSY 1 [Cynara cardunculus var. scolymus]|uniref:SNF2 domain-containing protein CLASSY 1 n=1 Tax=Cynara cardunculus var. scolymus TaxID=59895 RepID=UPI000D62B610|nr:SNF2 domain-containing protein CLASSY 1 [Cynara cardunculus var. scolymus]XP_024989817.1 SNF2 domain-containing protein CLASSY 1 [Cynara cardunculus var. scolymus]XP_024989818.1 SNF2 domain-containing protein CLASSY 1 [Cynara cardunculus var. scolymus]XP_024989820.1 SNF2 domain-containing protein CLASSY 1 [Cynara cardunculus var. scolymus]XP_024989821.1 SNF2 domain-containing protein CLASSY 1 [Cynara cardunculus var. scolymus]XP_024989822.1 SNF2 domain-containing protein CLASSY 1 [Cynara ca
MKRKYYNLHQSTHQFNPQPFEAYWCGSWIPVERLRIRNGVVSMFIINKGDTTEETIPMSDLRITSRKATLMDCTCFLRPGIDVCVHAPYQAAEEESNDKNLNPVWIDAKITSLERKPHEEDKCACEFYVSIYLKQGPAGMIKKAVNKETKLVHIDQISILQKLEGKPSENNQYRWNLSEDCASRRIFKLFTGKFSSDISWLIVASVFKQLVFDVRSVDNQIVYQIWDGDGEKSLPDSENHSSAINFRLENGISIPFLVPFSQTESQEEKTPNCGADEIASTTNYDLMGLRRSKRRNIQPERYMGDDDVSESEVDLSRVGLYRPNRSKFEEVPIVLSIQDDHSFKDENKLDYFRKIYKEEGYLGRQNDTSKSKEVRTEVPYIQDRGEQRYPPSTASQGHSSRPYIYADSYKAEISDDEGGEISDIWAKYFKMHGSSKIHKRKYKAPQSDFDGGWKGLPVTNKRGRKKRGSSGKESIYDARTSFRKSVCASVYRELMSRCMRNIDASINIEQPAVIDQWNKFQIGKSLEERENNEVPVKEEEDEDEEMTEEKELEMLWKEMELALATTYLMEESEGSHDLMQKSNTQEQKCRHDYRLNEQFGIICRLCGHVRSEIKDVSPAFLPGVVWTPSKETRAEDDAEQNKENVDTRLEIVCRPASSNMVVDGKENVWALIPNLRDKLRFHQKRAFEFLWRNLAGDIVPSEMEAASKRRGGCVISHTPGAGKTLLIISFLVSYLKLFPGSRPLVLAPKTTLYTWYKEIIKWEIPIPVYQIHGGQTYREQVLRNKLKLAPGLPRNQDVMHVLDCLEKIQKWLTSPSVLLMGYTSFLTLTREDSNYAHRQYMAKVLRQCPGILILDEGHNPRSTKSRLRKALMKVDTPLRVLLSGTLFQNNFGEYFNTLTLARPRFVTEVLKKLDPKFQRRKKGVLSKFSLENRARKLFVIKIAEQINSNVPKDRQQGLSILRSLTSRFIDNYEGGSAENLPGLQCYTLMMKSTTIQQDILLKLQDQRPVYKGFPLELELLITLGSIHPWLIQTTACASQYFKEEELKALDRLKFDLKLGSKVRFVMSLVPRCLLRKEKVLIFCHNIAPINLFLETFDRFYGWKKGEEVLVLQGELELFERGRVMDKFEEPGGPSKVMLASINACAEGISLTAASRVILLDSEWNPSKSKQAIARAFRPGQDKVVYVYQLLATGTLEEEKHSRTTWKEWVSSMIFSEELVEDPSHWQAPKIEDELLREIVEEDRASLFHAIMKNEKASNMVVRGRE